MTSEFNKEYLPIWCEDCDQQGYIFIDNLDDPCFIICKACGWETSHVSCPKCQMGGEFVRNISERPSSWICPSCQTQYPISSAVYENPTRLYVEKELPFDIRQRIEKKRLSSGLSSPIGKFYAYLFLGIIIATLLIPWWLIYKLVNYLPDSIKPMSMVLFFLLCLAWLFVWRYFVIAATPRINKWRLKMTAK